MSGVKLTIDNKELVKLNKQFILLSGKINGAGNEGLEKVGMKIGEDAQRNLTSNKSIATGQLRNSLKVLKDTDNGIKVEFESQHAANVEFGQKAGTEVSPSRLVQWLKKKNFTIIGARGGKVRSGKSFNSAILGVAFAISKKIKRRGTKAAPFLYPAFRKNEQEVLRVLGNAIKKVI